MTGAADEGPPHTRCRPASPKRGPTARLRRDGIKYEIRRALNALLKRTSSPSQTSGMQLLFGAAMSGPCWIPPRSAA